MEKGIRPSGGRNSQGQEETGKENPPLYQIPEPASRLTLASAKEERKLPLVMTDAYET